MLAPMASIILPAYGQALHNIALTRTSVKGMREPSDLRSQMYKASVHQVTQNADSAEKMMKTYSTKLLLFF